jgi:thiol:disulfide interchange protein DsbD
MCERPNEAAFVAKMGSGGAGGAAAKPAAQQPATQGPATQGPGSGSKPEPVLGLGTAPGLVLDEEKITIRASFDPPTVRAGEVTTLVLDVDVIDGWHAYGTLEPINTPVGFDLFKQDAGDLEFEGEAIIPPGIEQSTPVGPTFPLPHHFQVKQHVRVPAGTAAGTIDVVAVLDYQICDESGCENPTEGDAEVTLTVVAGEARSERMDVPQDPVVVGAEPDEGDGPGATNESTDPDDEEERQGWWWLILSSIGGGLFALAMPCTYPMIPITFSFFTKQAEKRGGSVLGLTIVYGLGIIAMFVAVGVLLSAVIIDVVNHWATNTVIGLMFFFFAFVLFGWINLSPPQFLNKLAYKAQGSAASGGGSGEKGGLLLALVGVFFMGATLVITSFTCTAPIVGTLIANVASEGLVRVGVGMAIFGLTMAIPFMALSLMPGKVKAMPKSGEWMETLKISLGFVELAAAFKFVSMVDFAFGWQALPRELFLMLWTAIFGLWAMFLFGILRKAGTVNEGVSNGRMAGGMFVSLLAAYFFFGAIGNKLDVIMTGFVPGYSSPMVVRGGGEAQLANTHFLVKDDPDKATALAVKEGKLVLYNFTGFN